jgi:hypothetical protein
MYLAADFIRPAPHPSRRISIHSHSMWGHHTPRVGPEEPSSHPS